MPSSVNLFSNIVLFLCTSFLLLACADSPNLIPTGNLGQLANPEYDGDDFIRDIGDDEPKLPSDAPEIPSSPDGDVTFVDTTGDGYPDEFEYTPAPGSPTKPKGGDTIDKSGDGKPDHGDKSGDGYPDVGFKDKSGDGYPDAIAASCGLNKVLVCKVPPGNPSARHEICVGVPAVEAHLMTGSYLGLCD